MTAWPPRAQTKGTRAAGSLSRDRIKNEEIIEHRIIVPVGQLFLCSVKCHVTCCSGTLGCGLARDAVRVLMVLA